MPLHYRYITNPRFVSSLLDTLPEPLNTCYLTNSGSEANDLALRLASASSGTEDVLVFEDGSVDITITCADCDNLCCLSLKSHYARYHGNISSLIDASPKMHGRTNHRRRDHVHIARLPDLYRGPYR